MGLAASQGRLLLLTARKSDLEYQDQQIAQQRLILSQQLESVSSEYARKTGNRNMKITFSTQQTQTNKANQRDLNMLNFMEYVVESGAMYRIVDAEGKVIVPTTNNKNSEAIDNYLEQIGADDSDVKHLKVLYHEDACNALQEGLRNGIYRIQVGTDDGESGEGIEWDDISWSGMSDITDGYYTEDDAQAEAEYNTKTSAIQSKDKRLELQQNQIETQHKAVETEVESVQKIIQSNIESSFKMFS